MFKKIALGALLAGLVGALVIGAVNRTQSKVNGESQGAGGNRQGQAQLAVESTGGASESEGGQSTATASGAQPRAGQGRGAGANGAQAGQGSGQRGNGGDAAAPISSVVTLEGVAGSVDASTLSVTLSDGKAVSIADRGWTYAQSQGFTAQPGDKLTLAGFYDGETFEAVTITNNTSGQSVTLRDETGRPMWAGRGRTG